MTKKESQNALWRRRDRIWDRLTQLPQGTVKEREISGRTYYYLQRREGKKVRHTYLGKAVPADIQKKMRERKQLRAELDKIQGALLKFVAAKIRGLL